MKNNLTKLLCLSYLLCSFPLQAQSTGKEERNPLPQLPTKLNLNSNRVQPKSYADEEKKQPHSPVWFYGVLAISIISGVLILISNNRKNPSSE